MSTENITVEEKKNSTKTKADLAAENEALKAELEALKAAQANSASNEESATSEAGPKMVKIKLPRTKKDQEDVFVSVNNYTCIIKRGVEVEVPDFVAEVLTHQEEMLEKIMLFEDAVNNKNK